MSNGGDNRRWILLCILTGGAYWLWTLYNRNSEPGDIINYPRPPAISEEDALAIYGETYPYFSREFKRENGITSAGGYDPANETLDLIDRIISMTSKTFDLLTKIFGLTPLTFVFDWFKTIFDGTKVDAAKCLREDGTPGDVSDLEQLSMWAQTNESIKYLASVPLPTTDNSLNFEQPLYDNPYSVLFGWSAADQQNTAQYLSKLASLISGEKTTLQPASQQGPPTSGRVAAAKAVADNFGFMSPSAMVIVGPIPLTPLVLPFQFTQIKTVNEILVKLFEKRIISTIPQLWCLVLLSIDAYHKNEFKSLREMDQKKLLYTIGITIRKILSNDIPHLDNANIIRFFGSFTSTTEWSLGSQAPIKNRTLVLDAEDGSLIFTSLKGNVKTASTVTGVD